MDYHLWSSMVCRMSAVVDDMLVRIEKMSVVLAEFKAERRELQSQATDEAEVADDDSSGLQSAPDPQVSCDAPDEVALSVKPEFKLEADLTPSGDPTVSTRLVQIHRSASRSSVMDKINHSVTKSANSGVICTRGVFHEQHLYSLFYSSKHLYKAIREAKEVWSEIDVIRERFTRPPAKPPPNEGDGRVFDWGRGTFGRLGTERDSDELVPVHVEFGSAPDSEGKQVKIIGIAAGAYHCLALTDDGSVWCWGYNIYGQLGVYGDNSLAPRLLDDFLELGSPGPLTGGSETKKKNH